MVLKDAKKKILFFKKKNFLIRTRNKKGPFDLVIEMALIFSLNFFRSCKGQLGV